MVNGKEVRVFIQEILPATSATVKARKTEIYKVDEEIERALKQKGHIRAEELDRTAL